MPSARALATALVSSPWNACARAFSDRVLSLSRSAAGYDAVETTEAGWTLEQLKGAGCTPKELRKAGHSATAMRVVGFEIEHLKRCAAPPLLPYHAPPRPHPGPGVSHHI